ncbi:hypothetical protein [Oceanobacillus sp. CF4.6]
MINKARRKLTDYFIGDVDEVPVSDEIWFYGFATVLLVVPVIVFIFG